MYLAYSILYLIALLFLFPFEYLKRPKELRKRWIRERFGLYKTTLQHSNTPVSSVWIHAVSVGEVIAAVPLIKKIKERHPATEVIVSTVTDTGQKIAREKAGDTARIIYMPFDLPLSIKNAANRFNPSIFIIMETELWPNAIRTLNKLNVPVLLMNGRISEKSFIGYKGIRFFIKNTLRDMSLFCVQNELYADRLKALGAKPEKVRVIGSLKFDTGHSSPVPEWTKIFRRQKGTVPDLRTEQSEVVESGLSPNRQQIIDNNKEFVIVAGSTHRTEEDIILDAYIKLKKDFPETNLIIAPRHPERFKEVEELIKKKELEYIKRSDVTGHESRVTGVVILLDVIGELSSVYSACDVAIMGGSFIEHGGQNPLEPAYWGKAIVCGPHMENFPFIDDFYRGGGALKVNAENLYQTVKELLNSQEKILSMGKIAKELYEKNAGATDRAMEIIGKYL
ncbi:3-deoxy-D-manno-octulosonic acid transferase [Dissulfurispira sp.]|uniref:3-deoxy-D-manno-octulosonic acid transferase n=1 Tax=Dissulfurispira sp. TaxID=2817609 RepID=UPI002FD9BB52